jgi:hypothetical protein
MQVILVPPQYFPGWLWRYDYAMIDGCFNCFPLCCCKLNFYPGYDGCFSLSFCHILGASLDILRVDNRVVVVFEFF